MIPNELLLNFSVCARGLLKKETRWGVVDKKSFDKEEILHWILFLEDERVWRSNCNCALVVDGDVLVCVWEVKEGLCGTKKGLMRLLVLTTSLIVSM